MDNSEVTQEALQPEVNPQTNDSDVTPEKRERYLQQIEWSKKEAERKEALLIETYTDLVSQDASHLDRLQEKDPDLANKVAKSFWYDSYQDIKDSQEEPNSGLSESDFEKWYEKRRTQDEHELASKKANDILSNLPEDVQEKATIYYNMIADWKTLTSETAKEFAEMATLYVNKGKLKTTAHNDWLAMLWSTWLSKWSVKKVPDNEPQYVIRGWKLTLISND